MARVDVLSASGDLPSLVTGGCGFVGRHLVRRLAQAGRRVWIADDMSTGRPIQQWLPEPLLSRVAFVRSDVREFLRLHRYPDQWAKCIPRDRPATFSDVFHLAAVVGGRVKIESDPLAVAQDLAIDADFFTWAVQTHPRRILYASSSAAYPVRLQGSEGAVSLREDFIAFDGNLGQPDMTYGWAKLTGEYLARIAASHYGLQVACVRPFSGYGEDQETSYPVPAIVERVARREDPLTIWGSGDQGRDFVYIEDCVDAMLRAIEEIDDGSAVNIGTGRLTTFKEVARIVARLAGYEPEIRPLVGTPSGVAARYADTTKLRELLGWIPKVSLEEGLSRVYEGVLVRLQNVALTPT